MSLTVESPCISVCVTDQNDMCLGCGRYLNEIAQWGAASEEEKERIARESALRIENL